MMDKPVRDPRTHAIIGAAMQVHTELGHGFLEPVYQEALELELADRRIPYRREVDIVIHYKGRPLKCTYKADFVCYDSIIVELKALFEIGGREMSQVINYLKATGMELGLLFNIGAESLQFERIVRSGQHPCIEP